MSSVIRVSHCIAVMLLFASAAIAEPQSRMKRIAYNHPGLVVDLGVGLWAWPLPMDYDGDGDFDLIVSCPDVPNNGVYFFENPGGADKLPVFKRGVRIGEGLTNVQLSQVGKSARVLGPGVEYVDFHKNAFSNGQKLPLAADFHGGKIRANQWKLVDYDGDSVLDLLIGIEDWSAYGWDNAFNDRGEWTNGPLHGYVYLARNSGSHEAPEYAAPTKLTAGGKVLDTYGMPSPNLADFDGDGDLDLLCGEFVDKLTYFQNVGTRTEPSYVAGRFLTDDDRMIHADLCMIVPVAVDWEGDGDMDVVVGQEDGRVYLLENIGLTADGLPHFATQEYFQQEAADLKFGALATPVSYDWDSDGDEDLICGNTAGEIAFIENLDGGNPPNWAKPELLSANGRTIRIQAGPTGSVQGPCESKWGYTTIAVADWNQDCLPDIVGNSIWGKVFWHENVGTRTSPELAESRPIEVAWKRAAPKPSWNWWNPDGDSLVTQWRTTPFVIDWDGDSLYDLVMLDHEGYLCWFRRMKNADGNLSLLPPERVFTDEAGKALQLAVETAGGSGRRKFCIVDWDGDGGRDLLVDSKSIKLFRGIGEATGLWRFRDEGEVDPLKLAGHDTSPTCVDWNRDGVPDLLAGAEDGFFYYLQNPRSAKQ